ncbi:hypothetical protein IFM89_022600 [Coptis chinensis]|uniref:RING-type domain-containing protein n=1 Tax=Coptis chinensis TaxID=261450 RepID=A0A835IEV3_9MAGN|nr:hypothetical protein IFM89_022600 [Coptis chinensis]
MSTFSIDSCFDLDLALTTPVQSSLVTKEPDFRVAELPTVSSIGGVCMICMEEFNRGKDVAKRLACNHVYHETCVSTWLSQNNSCPLCRCSIFHHMKVVT